ncbi:hypothetical protein DRJ04_02140 [Candidatus Aerophobetes bacterium]|uniref:ATP-dependent Clp protease proteolytic subunit n=1 Tax=Aerophobetes bacterium TaxID=2030807 RepID=A0A662DJ93_UNCAE|nr:MAG: hypothetical protein DRJ04_02140 [Candidatus Aerophobetes bacterium]
MIKKAGMLIIIFLFITSGAFSLAKMPEIDRDNWVSISGEIDREKAEEVILALMNLDSKPGTAPIGIRISSPGGSLMAVMAICDTIKNLRHPVVTLALGEAISGAAVILSCGDERFIGDYTMVMLHQPSVIFENWSSNFEELQQFTLALGKIENQMYRLLAQNTGKSEEEIKKLLKKEVWFTAKEAIEFGLADELLSEGGLRIKEEPVEPEEEEKEEKEKSDTFPSSQSCQSLK